MKKWSKPNLKELSIENTCTNAHGIIKCIGNEGNWDYRTCVNYLAAQNKKPNEFGMFNCDYYIKLDGGEGLGQGHGCKAFVNSGY